MSRPLVRRSAAVAWLGATVALAALVPLTPKDFRLAGTQVGDVSPGMLEGSSDCRYCHGDFDRANEPYATWAGSLMGLAGRDPLFYAQLANANQDVARVGSFCLRCHVPMSVVSGHLEDPTGAALDELDRDGVTCHFCHSLVDPDFVPGESPPEDEGVLAALDAVPAHVGNAMFVLDPQGRRRGPYDEHDAPHVALASSYLRESALCGTCHDVGNVAVSRREDGTYRYNAVGEAVPDEALSTQFPLERTYTEWKLSAFAAGGVDLGERFGGQRPAKVSTCQDCHMPTTTAPGCWFGRERSDLARHEFAGAAAPVLDLIVAQQDPAVEPQLVAAARSRAVSMLQRAATLQLERRGRSLRARVINQSGHKLPTGHIEGRRIWLNVRFLDAGGALLAEHGAYDAASAELDEASTTVFEMRVGLSAEAAAATGLPAGITGHMALADTIEQDNRIPPRGFANGAYEAAGAPAVGASYADGQFWADQRFRIPRRAARAEATLYYQSLPRFYVEELRAGNLTDSSGETLHALWEETGRGAPIAMAARSLPLRRDWIFGDGFESGFPDAWVDLGP